MNIKTIDINKLTVSPLNVRKLSNDESLLELVNNIKEHGLLNPITVLFNDSINMYEIIAGQRRHYAMKELKYNNIQCNVILNKQEREQIIISLTENIHRDNMNLSDRVKTYNKLLDKYYDHNKTLKDRISELSNITNTKPNIIKQYKEISHFSDSILDNLDKKGNERMSIEFAIQLSKIGIMDEEELQNIIDLFHNVKQSDRIKLMKKIQDGNKFENSDKKEFHKYIEKIGKIKTEFLKEMKKKEEDEKRIREEIEERNKKTKENDKKNDIIISEDEYKSKINNIIDNNLLFVENNKLIRNPIAQDMYRKAIINRYKKCIISNMNIEVCEACHIIPFSESNNFDINNGLLLNSNLHKLFDKYYWSINPETLCVEVSKKCNTYDCITIYNNKHLVILKQFNETIEYLKEHYKQFKMLYFRCLDTSDTSDTSDT